MQELGPEALVVAHEAVVALANGIGQAIAFEGRALGNAHVARESVAGFELIRSKLPGATASLPILRAELRPRTPPAWIRSLGRQVNRSAHEAAISLGTEIDRQLEDADSAFDQVKTRSKAGTYFDDRIFGASPFEARFFELTKARANLVRRDVYKIEFLAQRVHGLRVLVERLRQIIESEMRRSLYRRLNSTEVAVLEYILKHPHINKLSDIDLKNWTKSTIRGIVAELQKPPRVIEHSANGWVVNSVGRQSLRRVGHTG